MNKRKNFLVVFSFLVVLVGSFVFSGCETSRVGPEVPRPNPPAPTPQAVVLSGYVLDAKTGSGIANATVSLVKLDGTSVSSAVTNGSGLYSFDLTALNLTVTNFKILTTVTGYGTGFVLGTYDKALNSAGVQPLLLTKIENTVTVTMGVAGGAATVPPTTDAKTTTPVQVTVPPNAVPAGTQVTLAAVPVQSTPPPASTTQNIVSSNNLEAPGVTTFSQPVTMTFNLPLTLPAGTLIPLIIFNKTTNLWENTGLNATVSADGVTASVAVTKPGSYALLGNVSCVQTVDGKITTEGNGISITHLQKVLGTKDIVIELSATNLKASYTGAPGTPPVIKIITGNLINHPTSAFSYGLIKSRFGRIYNANLNAFIQSFAFNLPATLGGKATTNSQGVQQGPDNAGTTGEWINRITIKESTVIDIFNLSQAGLFSQDVEFSDLKTTVTSEWYWRVHNQGGLGVGPF